MRKTSFALRLQLLSLISCVFLVRVYAVIIAARLIGKGEVSCRMDEMFAGWALGLQNMHTARLFVLYKEK